MAEPQAPNNPLPREVQPKRVFTGPIQEDATSVSFLGVKLPKPEPKKEQGAALIENNPFIPKRENYDDFIDDAFSLDLQKKIAAGFVLQEPLLIEGGTSIGKTTSVKRMCALLGYEVHYLNLNGQSDVENLMGRYIPNPNRTKPEDPEYIFADGQVTQALRQEEGKIKVLILDEFNSARPEVLIRLHEVLDNIRRGESVVLSEDASEAIEVSRQKTHIVALMNPPGKGYLGREALDPAQLRRWTYLKEPSDLPEDAFSHATDALFGLGEVVSDVPKEQYLASRDQALLPEELAEIPGIQEINDRYKEFHAGAKQLVAERKIGADQPQKFTFDDRMDPMRVRDFIMQFYNGDITETFQEALKYFYRNKLESQADRDALGELIEKVKYDPPPDASKRKGLNFDVPQTMKLVDGSDVTFLPSPTDLGGQRLEHGMEFVDTDGTLCVYLGTEPQSGEIIYIPKTDLPESYPIEEDAREIFGGDLLGQQAVKQLERELLAHGVEVEFLPPTALFMDGREMLAELKNDPDRDHFIVYRPEKMKVDGEEKPITLPNLTELFRGKIALIDESNSEAELQTIDQPMEAGYAAVQRGILPGSVAKTFGQQEMLLKPLERRRIAVESVWDTLLYYFAKNERLYLNNGDITRTELPGGRRAAVGGFGAAGIKILDIENDSSDSDNGMSPTTTFNPPPPSF